VLLHIEVLKESQFLRECSLLLFGLADDVTREIILFYFVLNIYMFISLFVNSESFKNCYIGFI